MTGQSNSVLSTGDKFWVDAYAENFTPCTGSPTANSDEIILKLPKAVGTYSLSLQGLNETFYVASTNYNLVASSGSVVIDTVTATTISGGANFAYDAANTVNGQFQATICP